MPQHAAAPGPQCWAGWPNGDHPVRGCTPCRSPPPRAPPRSTEPGTSAVSCPTVSRRTIARYDGTTCGANMNRLDRFLAYAESHRYTVWAFSGVMVGLISWGDWVLPNVSIGFLYLF